MWANYPLTGTKLIGAVFKLMKSLPLITQVVHKTLLIACRIAAGQHTFYYHGVKIWTALSKDLR